MNYLDKLESKSIYIIREAYKQFKDIAVLWSIGKDSTALMWLTRKAFYGHIPFPAVHIDTGYKFKEIYDFRDKWSKEWNFRLIIGQNEGAIGRGMNPDTGKLDCCVQLLKITIRKITIPKSIDFCFMSCLLLALSCH